jgi:Fe-S-cluster containining protein
MSKLGCRRCGSCCKSILLHLSPRQIREGYDGWKKQISGVIAFQDIFLIAPMVMGLCRGKIREGKGFRYVYGPCRHLIIGDKSCRCAIHSIRPELCKGYPYYAHIQSVKMGLRKDWNEGYIKGCGYNEDKDIGFTQQGIDDSLWKLTDREK